jgi:hypothetical protein
LSKATSFDANSNLELVRTATLEVWGAAGVVVRCDLAPEQTKGSVVYRFEIAADHLAESQVTIAEIDDYKANERLEHLIGGGTFFELRLGDVVKP